MELIKKPIEIIKQNKKAYLVANAIFYGLVILGMVLASLYPQLQEYALSSTDESLDSSLLSVENAYSSGNILLAAALTFLINLIIGVVVTMTLPSFVLPFVGILMSVYRAVFWGILFPPSVSLIPHYVTLLIEGQAYVIAMLAIYLHGKSFLFPRKVGRESRWSGYKLGIAQTAWLYVGVTAFLLVGAIWEAVEVILLIPPLS